MKIAKISVLAVLTACTCVVAPAEAVAFRLNVPIFQLAAAGVILPQHLAQGAVVWDLMASPGVVAALGRLSSGNGLTVADHSHFLFGTSFSSPRTNNSTGFKEDGAGEVPLPVSESGSLSLLGSGAIALAVLTRRVFAKSRVAMRDDKV